MFSPQVSCARGLSGTWVNASGQTMPIGVWKTTNAVVTRRSLNFHSGSPQSHFLTVGRQAGSRGRGMVGGWGSGGGAVWSGHPPALGLVLAPQAHTSRVGCLWLQLATHTAAPAGSHSTAWDRGLASLRRHDPGIPLYRQQ